MNAGTPTAAARVLLEEQAMLRPAIVLPPAEGGQDLETAIRDAHRHRLSALCLSGGGVRSASFAAGLIEGLARHNRLLSFDYMSTVSGGGYAGSWLSAWRYHARRSSQAVEPPEPWPDQPAEPGNPAEPAPLLRLRRYTRYLAPHEGALSIDLWTIIATMGRNMLLIWLVLMPILAAMLLVPYTYYAVVRRLDRDLVKDATLTFNQPDTLLLLGSCVLLITAVLYMVWSVPSLGGRNGTQRQFLTWCLLPLCAGALGLTFYWAYDTVAIRAGPTILAAAIGSPAVWMIAGLRTEQRWRPKTWIAATVSGALCGAGVWFLATGPYRDGRPLLYGYATFGFPLLLLIGLLGTVVHVGLSRDETSDADLEWWSRYGAWVLVVAIAWIAVSTIVLWCPLLIRLAADRVRGLSGASSSQITAILGILTTSAGGLVALSGRAIHTDPERERMLPRIVAALAVPSFVVLLLSFLAMLNLKTLHSISTGVVTVDHSIETLMRQTHLAEAIALCAILLAFGTLMALQLPVNKFSLHGMYRNRIVRTFVGAARPESERTPNAFTDFDNGDDVAMADLAPLGRPMHVVNATLNMVADRTLADQQRKSESFTMSPLHAGSWKLGYRPVSEYAADHQFPHGMTLGTAATISGAAASPNMGARSTPALTFLMTILNARLGAWVGNPGRAGGKQWRLANPRVGPWLLLRELFGSTTDRSRYVFLSDGGHFENLALYEMVRRRCNLIVVSDAGCDPAYAFNDLANAIRLIRIDFSIPIVFPDGVPITAERDGQHFAIGRILYSAVDGEDAPDGTLVYAKATVTGDEPWDVLNYAESHPAFPHESTANQFFSEAQFESYRMLGRHTVDQIFAGRASDIGVTTPEPAQVEALVTM